MKQAVINPRVIPDSVRSEILRRISAAEQEHNVKVLFAIESGSRAWGFESANSDFDVRFVYIHEKDWYLTIDVEEKRDVIEYPITDEIDINGWELRKALKLFRKSNPAILEWIQSPIVYRDDGLTMTSLRDLISLVADPRKAGYHYFHMARNNFREYLKKEQVPLKKYFYVLRPLLAIRWLEAHQSQPPIEFDTLCELIVDQVDLKDAIDELLVRKRAATEKEMIYSVPVINDFIASELARNGDSDDLQFIKLLMKRAQHDHTPRLNHVFQQCLENEI